MKQHSPFLKDETTQQFTNTLRVRSLTGSTLEITSFNRLSSYIMVTVSLRGSVQQQSNELPANCTLRSRNLPKKIYTAHSTNLLSQLLHSNVPHCQPDNS